MLAHKLKSRSLRRVKRKVAGNRVAIHYEQRKPKKAHCAKCGAELLGVPRGTVSQIGKLSKSEKRPQRPFGGNLCSKCMREVMINKANALNKNN